MGEQQLHCPGTAVQNSRVEACLPAATDAAGAARNLV